MSLLAVGWIYWIDPRRTDGYSRIVDWMDDGDGVSSTGEGLEQTNVTLLCFILFYTSAADQSQVTARVAVYSYNQQPHSSAAVTTLTRGVCLPCCQLLYYHYYYYFPRSPSSRRPLRICVYAHALIETVGGMYIIAKKSNQRSCGNSTARGGGRLIRS